MERCALCPGTTACIPPDGEGDLLFIGEAPGKDENKQALRSPPGRPFIGKTGDEVNRHYLQLAGLRRDRVAFTNAIRCLPSSAGGKLDPKRVKDLALLQSCAESGLYPLIEQGAPRVLIPMGSFACKAVCPGINLDLQHGIPVDTPWGIPAFPMFHPAQGIHEPKKMLQLRNDWIRLRHYLQGHLSLPQDRLITDYAEVTDAAEFDALDPTLPLACDTESTRKREPYCLTYSQSPGTGRLIRASRTDLLGEFRRRVCASARWQAPILFHNYLYDQPVTVAMGLDFPTARIVDTMARVFHLGNLPQGLKALAFRELGMVMEDFEDVVKPYSTQNVLIYYRIAASYPWPKPEEEMVIDDKTGLWKLYKPQSMNTKLKRFFTDYGKNEEKDVFDMWTDNWTASQAMIEAECGEWPGMCISHVPFDKVLYYACRDVDALIRLWPVLEGMRRQVRRVSQDQWRAA